MKILTLFIMTILIAVTNLPVTGCSFSPPQITPPTIEPPDIQQPSPAPSKTPATPPEITSTPTLGEPTALATKVEIITPYSAEEVYFKVKGETYPLTRSNEIYASGIVDIAYGNTYTIIMGDQQKEGVFHGGYHEYLKEAHRTGEYPWSTLRLPDELMEVEEFLFDYLPIPETGHSLVKGFSTGAGGAAHVEKTGNFFESVEYAFPDMRQAGANWVNIVPMWFFFPYDNNSLQVRNELRPVYREEFYNGLQGDGYNYATYTDDELRGFIEEAHATGLKVYLVPHITPANWGPETAAGKPLLIPDDIDDFFENYKKMIAHYARLAEETGVELLGLGCENDSLTIEEQEWYPGVDLTAKWYEIIEVARSHYNGPLTYSAAAGDREYIAPSGVKFWDALDYIGFEWYIPVTDRREITISELTQIAQGFIEDMAKPLHEEYGKPIIMTEVGFEAKPYAWTRSYEGSGQESSFDRLAAAICYEYLFQAIEDYEFIEGMFIWSWQPANYENNASEIFPWDMWWSITNDGNQVQHTIVLPQIAKWFHYYSD
jgi:hypothetical protein